MKRIFKTVNLNKEWKKVTLKKHNDFYLTAIKSEKNGKKDNLNKDCVKRIRFEIAVEGGKKDSYMTINYLTLNFNDFSSSNAEFNAISAITKAVNFPSTFYIRAIDMTGESSTVTEGITSIEVYINELKLK